ncbi:hypothetical protein DKP78_21645, partial [Enterococcus faecium]
MDRTAGPQPFPDLSDCEFPVAPAWSQPTWHHHQVRGHGQEGNQQTAETEGEEERVRKEGQTCQMERKKRKKKVTES